MRQLIELTVNQINRYVSFLVVIHGCFCIGLGVVLVMNQCVFPPITFFCIYINSLLELRMKMKFVCLCRCLMSQSTIFQSCRDGATASWVLPVLFGEKCLFFSRTQHGRGRYHNHVQKLKGSIGDFRYFFDVFFDIFSIFFRYFLSIKSPFYILSYSLYKRLDISSFRCVDVSMFCLSMFSHGPH